MKKIKFEKLKNNNFVPKNYKRNYTAKILKNKKISLLENNKQFKKGEKARVYSTLSTRRIIENKHQIYNDRLLLLEKEKEYLIKKIDSYNNTQNQLILLIKLIQNIGIDIGQLIDEYNNSVTIKNSNNIINKSKNENNSLSELDSEFESNSFIPINIEKTKEHKLSKIPIPKLNFDILYQKKEKNIFNNIFKNIHDK